ncbi:MAG TPA: hypothetical protein VFS42_12255 [Burkholderiaceae bacterium]|nr:hypothetical protein [Burkholderiaceae bacterium]
MPRTLVIQANAKRLVSAPVEEVGLGSHGFSTSSRARASHDNAAPQPTALPMPSATMLARGRLQAQQSKAMKVISSSPQAPMSAVTEHRHEDDDHAHHHHAEHEHGGMVIDIDEAVHGSYAAVQYSKDAAEKGTAEVAKSLSEEAHVWQTEPAVALRQTALPEGAVDLGLSLGVSAFLAPLALLAVKAGIEELKDSQAHEAALEKAQQKVEQMVNDLQTIETHGLNNPNSTEAEQRLDHLIQTYIAQGTQRTHDIQHARRQNHLAGQIGWGSLISGGSIGASVAVSLLTKPTLAGLAGDVANTSTFVASSVAAATAATAAGAASTIALGPLAGIGALYLGDRFVRKSSAKKKQFLANSTPTKTYLNAVKREATRTAEFEGIRPYHQFVHTKALQRENFYKRFVSLNKLFRTGSAVYAAGATGKAVVAGLALAGVGAAATTGGLGVLIPLGTVGGLMMGAGSVQFLVGHEKQTRYDGYFTADDPEIDRHFLATVDVLAPESTTLNDGLRLRAHLYQRLNHREELRQDFLKNVADDLGKYQRRIVYSTDPVEARDQKTVHRGSFMERARSRGAWVSQFAKTLVAGGNWQEARSEARIARSESTDRLTTHTFQNWLNEHRHFDKQIDFMLETLADQRRYLEHKVDIRSAIWNDTLSNYAADARSIDITALEDAEARESATALKAFLADHQLTLTQDKALLAQTQLLENHLLALKSLVATPRPQQSLRHASTVKRQINDMRDRFMQLQSGTLIAHTSAEDKTSDSATRFAKFLLKEAPKRYKDLRGTLLETELQATRLRDLARRMVDVDNASTTNDAARHSA